MHVTFLGKPYLTPVNVLGWMLGNMNAATMSKVFFIFVCSQSCWGQDSYSPLFNDAFEVIHHQQPPPFHQEPPLQYIRSKYLTPLPPPAAGGVEFIGHQITLSRWVTLFPSRPGPPPHSMHSLQHHPDAGSTPYQILDIQPQRLHDMVSATSPSPHELGCSPPPRCCPCTFPLGLQCCNWRKCKGKG